MNANNDKNLCSNSDNFNQNAFHTNQSNLIQITSSSSLQITNLKDSTIKQLSKKAKFRSLARTNRKKQKRRRRK